MEANNLLQEISDYQLGCILGIFERGQFKRVAPYCYTTASGTDTAESHIWDIDCYYGDIVAGIRLVRERSGLPADIPDNDLIDRDRFTEGWMSGWNLVPGTL